MLKTKTFVESIGISVLDWIGLVFMCRFICFTRFQFCNKFNIQTGHNCMICGNFFGSDNNCSHSELEDT